MPYSYQITQASGSSAIVTVPFPYLDKSHVFVYLNGVSQDQSAFTWLSASSIQLPSTPAAGVYIKVQRHTLAASPEVTYVAGPLSHLDLNTETLQLLYLAQENLDGVTDAMGLGNDGVNFDARAKRITNLGQGTDSADAINLGQAQALISAAVLSPTVIVPVDGALNGTNASKTANFTVQNSDKGKTLVLGGSSYFTVTFNAAGTYDPNFQVRLYNNDGRAKKVVIPGDPLSPIFLWPNQTLTLQNTSGSWAVFPYQQRYVNPTGPIILYVRPAGSGGSDTLNDGLVSGSPLATISKAWSMLRDFTDGPGATIQLTPGDVFGPVGELDGDRSQAFGRLITIIGDPTLTNPTQFVGAGADILLEFRDGAWATLQGLSFGSTGNGTIGVSIQQPPCATSASACLAPCFLASTYPSPRIAPATSPSSATSLAMRGRIGTSATGQS
jgi:hypothetical protein